MSIAWTKSVEGGPARVNHAAVSIDRYIYSFAGYCSDDDFTVRQDIDIHRFDTVAMKWMRLQYRGDPADIPYQRYGHTVVVFEGSCIIYGGRNEVDGVSDHVYKFDVGTGLWSRPEVSGTKPPGRDGHSCTVIGDKMYLFGGYEESSRSFSKTLYTLDLVSYKWELVKHVGQPPLGRDFHSAVTWEDCMIVFGGRTDLYGGIYNNNTNTYDNRIYIYHPRDRHWTCPTVSGDVPTGRRSHCAFEHRGKVYVFGGYNGILDIHYNDLHVYDPEMAVWSICKPIGNSLPRVRRRASCCRVDDEIFIFGGTSPQLVLGSSEGERGDVERVPEGDDETDAEIDREMEALEGAVGFAEVEEDALMELSDMNVLDMVPSLKTRCMMAVVKERISYTRCLPLDLIDELKDITRETQSRLGLYLFTRILKDGKDRRFDKIKHDPKKFLVAWTLQGVWVFSNLLPTIIQNAKRSDVPIGIKEYLGWAVWLVGWLIQIVADQQKSSFRAQPENAGKFITSGLWALSRHPNYFGEILMWAGLYVSAFNSLKGWEHLSVVSPLFSAFILTKVSGIPMLERSGMKRWGKDPNYLKYIAETPALIPSLLKLFK
ncbi:kelch domain-containing protein 3-like [Watersipora subatra]|uniref:kelch domain-containing protein 3-like n=1 Tax=Watersipora subatra TaxID=2589382 RepID=UPI00355B790A